MRKITCLIIISLFCLSSILPAVNSYYIEKGVNDLENSLDSDLMDSAWPMFHHDNKHTGRSPFGVLGNAGVVKWKFNMSGLTISSPAIDKNGTIYIGGNTIGEDTFFAVNPDGSLKWSFDTYEWVISSPAIASDGTIYVGSINGFLYAISSDGDEKWRFDVGGIGESIFSDPAIANDGTIYFGATNRNIYALNPDGFEKWHYTTEDSVYSSPAVDDNGYVYIGSHDRYLYALNPNGSLIWRYKTGDSIKSSPTIDDGIIYFGSWDNYLYALYPNGTLRWKFDTGASIQCSPAIDLDGNIYVGSYNGWFYSVSSNGIENWRFKTDDYIWSSPIIDKFGIIYICSADGNLYILNPDGSLRWIFVTGVNNFIRSTPAIGEDGTIYICSAFITAYDYSNMYAINVVENNNPNKPTVEGPLNGQIDIEYFYTANSIDKDNDNISYLFDWDDGTNSGWTSFVPSGTTMDSSHVWNERDFYNVKVKAQDIWGHESEWSEPLIVFIEKDQPDNPTIKGPTSGKIKENQIYTIVTTDYQDDDVEYYIDWGDETNSGWIGPYSSGEIITVNHTWNARENYSIRVKARDVYGHESDWATLEVSMPKTHIHNTIIELLMKLFERFPLFSNLNRKT